MHAAEGGDKEVIQIPGENPEDCQWILDTEFWITYIIGACFFAYADCGYALFSPSYGIKRNFIFDNAWTIQLRFETF